MNGSSSKSGMTLIEILITASIIALLAAFIVPAVSKAIERRENALTASHMRIAINAFDLYRSEEGGYPPDKTPGVIPPEMVDYFNDLGIDWWAEQTDIGGHWDWDNGYHFAYSISIASPTASADQLEELDALLDDGDLTTGDFRKVGVQHHYILEE
jgi:type IV pilus assembly protein PilA